MDWSLDALTNWLKETALSLWNAFVEFIGDAALAFVKMILDLFVMAINAIGVPEFLTTYNLGTLLGNAGPTVVWIAATFRVGEGLSIIAAGFAFRLIRKLLTLGQW